MPNDLRKTTALVLCFVLILVSVNGTAVISRAAVKENRFTVEGIEYVILSVTDGGGTVKIKDGSGFAGGDLPNVVTNEGETYVITEIAQGAFKDCSNLSLTSLPEGLTKIGDSAFWGCSELACESLPDSLRSIGSSAFAKCSKLALKSLPESLETLGKYAFSDCETIAITNIPAGINESDGYAVLDGTFRNCTSLTEINIPEGITKIGSDAFNSCINLTTVKLPDSLTAISSQAFYHCPNLELTRLPSGVTTVDYQAFYDCGKMTYLVLGDNITSFSYQCFSSYPDLIISGEDTNTYQALQEAAEEKPIGAVIAQAWDGTQSGLSSKQSYITGNLTVGEILTLSDKQSLVVSDGARLTIQGNLTIEAGAKVSIAPGGTLVVEGTIVNEGTIINNGTIINHGQIDNQNLIESYRGEIQGNEITGEPTYVTKIDFTSYSAYYDAQPHAGITAYEGIKEGDILSYSNTYADKYGTYPDTAVWSKECPEYVTVNDTDRYITLKVERMVSGQLETVAIISKKVTIQKVNAEITEFPQTSAITEGDALKCSLFTGGKVVIKGTDIELNGGEFCWGSDVRDTVPAVSDSQVTKYSMYYYAGDTGNSVGTVSGHLPVTVNECTHEGIEQICKDGKAATCLETGKTDDVYCGQCGNLLEEGSEIPVLEHIWDEGKITTEATATQAGVRTYCCILCGTEKTEAIPVMTSASKPTEQPEKSSAPSTSESPDRPEESSEPLASERPADPGVSSTQAPTVSIVPADSGVTVKPNPVLSEMGEDSSLVHSTVPTVNLKKGMFISDRKTKGIYKITSLTKTGGTVAYQKPLGKSAKVTVPSSVMYGNIKFKVTSIAGSAFKNNRNVTRINIGANVAKIGKKAFYRCKCLKYIHIKTKKLKSVGSGAFSKIGKNTGRIKIIVPKKRKGTYRKVLRTGGLSKKIPIHGK